MLSLLWFVWLIFSALAIIGLFIGAIIKSAIGFLYILAYAYDLGLRIFGKKPTNELT